MEHSTALAVNLDDHDDIRRKLPLLASRVDEKRERLDAKSAELERVQAEVAAARADFDHWEHVFAGLRAMVPEWGEDDTTPQHDNPPAQEPDSSEPKRRARGGSNSVDIVVGIVNDAGREMRTREVRDVAAPYGLADDTVSWALWKASSLGRVLRLKRGRYAPLTPAPAQTETPDSINPFVESAQTEETAGVQTQ